MVDLSEIDRLRRRSDFQAADELLDHLLEGSPTDSELHVMKGRLAAGRGRMSDALTYMIRAGHLAPDDPGPMAWNVAALEWLLRFEDARACAAQALERFPASSSVCIAVGRLHLTLSEYAEAESLFRLAVETDRANTRAWLWWIASLRVLARWDEATAALETVASEVGLDAGLLLEGSRVYSWHGDYPLALHWAQRASDSDAEWPDPAVEVALLLRFLGRADEATELLEASCRKWQQSTKPLVALSQLLAWRDRHADALDRYRRAEQSGLSDVNVATGIVQELLWLGLLTEAEGVGRAALDRYPFSAQAPAWLAQVLSYEDRHAEALAVAQEALAQIPHSLGAFEAKIDALCQLGRHDEAASLALAGQISVPTQTLFWSTYARVQSLRDRDEEALATHERALQVNPYDLAALTGRINALFNLGRFSEMSQAASDAQSQRPHDPEVPINLGWCHFQNADYPAALRCFQDASNLDPFDSNIQHWHISALLSSQQFEEAEIKACLALTENRDDTQGIEDLAMVLAARNKHQEAEDLIRTHLPKPSDNFFLRLQLIQILVKTGNLETALDESNLALAERPQAILAYLWRSYVLELLRRFDEARETLVSARAQHSEASDLAVQAARLARAEGRLDQALEAVTTARLLTPDHRTLVQEHLELLRDLGRSPEAERVAREAVNQHPHVSELLTGLAWTYADQGRYDEALEVMDRATSTQPSDSECTSDHITLLLFARRFDSAKERCNTALRQHPRDRALLRARGRVLDSINQHEGALQQFRQLLKLNPLDLAVALDTSATLRSLRRFHEAERLIRSLNERFIHDQDLREELGWILRDQGRLTEAARIFGKLQQEARSAGERVNSAIGLGWVLISQLDPYAGARSFREALQVRSTSSRARLGLAWALIRQNDDSSLKEIEQLLLDVLERRPTNAEAHAGLGIFNYRLNRWQLAEYHLRRSIDLDPYHGNYADLGALLTKLGRLDEASDILETSLSHDWFDVQSHITIGALELEKALPAEIQSSSLDRAAHHFRQALTLQPCSGAAAIGLAVALSSGAAGGLKAAETILRDSLARPDSDEPPWRLRFILSRVLLQRGDETQRSDLYEEALDEARHAIEENPREGSLHFVAGVAEYKLSDADPLTYSRTLHRMRARRHLQRCREIDPAHREAARILRLLHQDVRTARRTAYGSVLLAVVSLSLLVALWSAFFVSTHVTSTVIVALTPVLVGLIALSLVLPLLIRVKLPGGVEADLSASLSQISSGPTGLSSAGSSGLSIDRSDLNAGPQGKMPHRKA